MTKPGRVAAYFLVGALLLQTAWILAVPPYRGSDEFDHVYRAASIVHGHWRPDPIAAPDGRGALIPVPREIVTDGTEVCSSYEYTKRDNCNPVDDLGDGLVTVSSAALLYNPVYYALVGWPARLLDGVDALYGMRVITSLLCSLLISLAAWSVAGWSVTRWPLVGLTLALTPVALYSTVVVAPNGIEIVAGVCVWAGLVGIARSRGRPSTSHLLALAMGASVLAGVRAFGPLWLGLILLTIGLAFGVTPVWKALRTRPVASTAGVVVTSASVAGAIWWTLSSRQLTGIETFDVAEVNPWTRTLLEAPLWVFQSIAAFPLRDQMAPMIVYACGLVAFLAFLGVAAFRADMRDRVGLALSVFLSLAVPFAFTVMTILSAGTFWQGRYTLPYAVGVALLAGSTLDKRPPNHRLVPPLLACGALCVLVAHVVSILGVLARELTSSPLSGDPRWITAPVWLVALLASLGPAAWLLCCRAPRRRSDPAGQSNGTESWHDERPFVSHEGKER